MSKFTDLLASPFAHRLYLVELTGYDTVAGGERTIYLSDAGYTTYPGDTPSNQHYDARLKSGFQFRRELFGNGLLGGRSIPGYGVLTFSNVDGAFDYVRNWSFYGRRCRALLGSKTFRRSEFGVIFDGVIESVEGGDTITIALRDQQSLLEVPLCASTFAGTGGWEGPATLKDVRKPVTIGAADLVEPVYLGVYAGAHIWAVSDPALGPIVDIAVYDGGLPLTPVPWPPSGGQYTKHLAEGGFSTGSYPTQVMTAGVWGHGGPSTYMAGTIAWYLQGGNPATPSADALALNALNNAAVGYYARGTEETKAQVLDTILASVGGYWGYDRAGVFDLGRIDAPTASPVATFTENEVLSIEAQRGVPPMWRINLGYHRAWRTLAQSEFAAAAPQTMRDFAMHEWRVQKWENAAVKTIHKNAQDIRWNTGIMSSSAGALTEVNRLGALHGVPREMFRVVVKTQPFALDLNQTVKIIDKRFNLAAGKNFIIVGMTEDALFSRVEMLLWG